VGAMKFLWRWQGLIRIVAIQRKHAEFEFPGHGPGHPPAILLREQSARKKSPSNVMRV